jgi:hypothetical protein
VFPLTRDRSRNRSAFGYRPTLNLIFGPNSGDTLDPRITFSRTSNATQFDSAGNLVYAPHNLLTFSESFDNSAWGKNAITIGANITAAPGGTVTADKIQETAVTNFFAITSNPAGSNGTIYTHSIYAKAGERTSMQVSFTVSIATVIFNLSNGTVTSSTGSSLISASMESVGNGWYRCITRLTTVASGANPLFHIVGTVEGGFTTFAGVAGNGIFIWGAQLNVGALQPYYPTTVKNALGFTQEFNNAAWTLTGTTATANATTAPDGSVTADRLTSGGVQAQVVQGITIASGATITGSCYLKNDGIPLVEVVLLASNNTTPYGRATFNLSTGVISTAASTANGGTNASASIVAVGNDWYRCSVTVTYPATTSAGIRINGAAVTGSFFAWGAQLSDSASLDPYVYNPAAAFTSTAYYGPRFDYDPSTLAPRGLLIEEQRTNSIRNNTMVGAVAGTPGTAPTNWVVSTGAGITRQLVEVGVENGIAYIDYRFSGTGSVVSDTQFDVGNFIAAASGQVWTHAVYCRLVAGSLTNVTVTQILAENSAAGAFLAASTQNITPTSAALGTQRYALTRTLNNALTAFTVPTLRVTSAGAIDVTVRIGLPQLELGAFATSVIPTTTAAATRTADVATMVGANFSNWYNQSEGTLFAETQLASTSARIAAGFDVNDGTTNNRTVFRALTAGGADQVVVRSATTTVASLSSAASPTAAVRRTAVAYKLDDFALSADGATPVTDTSGAVPVAVNQMLIGYAAGPAEYLGGYIRRIAYYPRRLSNSELQSVSR